MKFPEQTKPNHAMHRSGGGQRIGEVRAELTVLDELGFIFHPAGNLEAGTDGFIEVCDLDTGAPLGRYIAVQVKATDTEQPNYKASRHDVEYWRKQNVPFLLLRVMRRSGIVLWKLIDSHATAGTIRFSLEDDTLDRKAAAAIARLVDDRYLRDNPEFQNRLAKIALDDAKEAFASGVAITLWPLLTAHEHSASQSARRCASTHSTAG